MNVLLHACCAPCSTVAIERLIGAGHRVSLFFFNPNIFPTDERGKRFDEVRVLGEKSGLDVILRDGGESSWRRMVEPLAGRGEKSARCWVCFSIRLDAAAEEASRLGMQAFTTTLTTAPMKDSKIVFRIGRMLGKKHGVVFLDENFKKKNGVGRSVEICKCHGLYRQDYCGCEWSMQEAAGRRKAKEGNQDG